MREYLTRVVQYRHRVVRNCFWLLTVLFAVSAVLNSEMRPVLDSDLPKDDPQHLETEFISSHFPHGDPATVVLVCPKEGGVFAPWCLEKIFEVTEEAKQSSILAPDARVFSIADFPYPTGDADNLTIRDFIEVFPETEAEGAVIAEEARNDHLIHGRLVNEEGTAVPIMFRIDDAATQTEVHAELSRLRDVFGQGVNFSSAAFSMDFINAEIDKAATSEFGRLIVFAAPVVGLVIAGGVGFRSIPIALLVIGISTIWTFGILGLLGYRQNVITSSLPVVFTAVISSPFFHIQYMMRRQYREHHDMGIALSETYKHILAPVWIAGITTKMGFIVLLFAPLASLQDYGLFAAVGILSGVLACTVLVPALAFGSERSQRFLPEFLCDWGWKAVTAPPSKFAPSRLFRESVDRFAELCSRVTENKVRASVALATSFLVFVFSIAGFSKLVVDSKPTDFLDPTSLSRQGFDVIEERLHGSALEPIVIDCREEDGIYSPDCLSAQAQLLAFMDTLSKVGFTASLDERIARFHQVFMDGDPSFERIPDSAAASAQLLLGDDRKTLGEFHDPTRRYLKSYMFISAYQASEVTFIKDEINRYLAEENFPYPVYVGATFFPWARMIELIGESGKFCPMILALFLFLFTTGYFRNVRLGILALVPVTTSTLLVLGIMGYVGIPMDIANFAISVIAPAVAVDFFIHPTARMRTLIQGGMQVVPAAREAVKGVGPPIIFDCLTTLSFIALLDSVFVPVQVLGAMLVTALTVAVLMNLVSVSAFHTIFPKACFEKDRKVAFGRLLPEAQDVARVA